jgi:hypothetical protein
MKHHQLLEIIDLIQENLGLEYHVSYSTNGFIVQIFTAVHTEYGPAANGEPKRVKSESIIEYCSNQFHPQQFSSFKGLKYKPSSILEDLNKMLDALQINFKNKDKLNIIKEKIREYAEMKDVLDTL